jgi:hypothetical protein
MTNVKHKFLSVCLFLTLYMFRSHHDHHQERQIVSNSGSWHSVSVDVRCAGRKRPAHHTATDTECQLPEFVLTQFVSPDDDHDEIETCRELKTKINTENNCASRWSFCVLTQISPYRKWGYDCGSEVCSLVSLRTELHRLCAAWIYLVCAIYRCSVDSLCTVVFIKFGPK